MERDTVLLIHSIFGVIVFTTGLLQLLLKKGGATHRILGHAYLYAWLVLIISGAYLGGFLITIVGIFGFYFALTGARIGHLKNNGVTIFEKLLFSFGGIVAVAMLYYAFELMSNGDKSFAIIFAVFGSLFLFQTVQDISKYLLDKPLKKQVYGTLDWYFEHFTRMCISFIAAVTAFTSIQNLFKDNTLNFLMPTVIGTILINIAVKFFKKKFKIAE